MAATCGNIAALSYLIKNAKDLNLNLQTIGGETALVKTVQFCKPECLQILLNAGANPSIQTNEGENVFTLA